MEFHHLPPRNPMRQWPLEDPQFGGSRAPMMTWTKNNTHPLLALNFSLLAGGNSRENHQSSLAAYIQSHYWLTIDPHFLCLFLCYFKDLPVTLTPRTQTSRFLHLWSLPHHSLKFLPRSSARFRSPRPSSWGSENWGSPWETPRPAGPGAGGSSWFQLGKWVGEIAKLCKYIYI